MSEIDVAVARADEPIALANLMQLYAHDFSEHWAGLEAGELCDDGRFADYPLEAYWDAPDRVPLLFRSGGHLAGFALLNATSHSGLPVDRNMAEFFVVRKHRRDGAGTRAARTIFSRYPGVWEAAVARRNTAALAFWRRAVGGHQGVRDVEEIDSATAAWNGPILRFLASAS